MPEVALAAGDNSQQDIELHQENGGLNGANGLLGGQNPSSPVLTCGNVALGSCCGP